MSLTTNCPKCGGKLKTSVAETPQKYAPGCSPADDAAYLMRKQQQQLVANHLVVQAWHERMYGDVPDAPACMLTDTQTQEQTRALAVNQQRQLTANTDEDTVPDPPAIMLAPVKV
jgi:hypothetical protein